jgi:hypothetical protein
MKSKVRLRRVAFLGLMLGAVAAIALGSGTAQASSGRRSLKEMLARSELAFIGRVEKIEYLLSEPTGPEGVRVPHTFVTYRVERMFLGQAPGGSVTLRFVGGWDSRKMRYMASSNTPQFDTGDYDILFVEGNTRRMCPLVGLVNGRLRVIRGRVYTEMGLAVFPERDGVLRTGKMVRLEEVSTTSVNGRTFLTLTTGPLAVDFPGDAVEAEVLMAAIANLARDVAPAHVFVNADRAAPFAGPDMTPAPPPADKSPDKKKNGRSL